MIFLLSSCERKEDHNIYILTNPKESFLSATANDILVFSIYCSSDSRLSNLVISKRTEQTTSSVILDTNINTKIFEMKWEYRIPAFEDTLTNLNLAFTITDVDGYQSASPKVITVYTPIENEYLTETAGHVMYSHAAMDQFDAYDLINGTPLHSAQSDSTNIHIMDVSTDSVYGKTLSRKWVSPAGMKFVRFNDFDYANATETSLKNSYTAGNKRNFISNISDDDVLLTKLENDSTTCYFAIKVVNVIDQDSVNLDRYIFNIKK
jgi:hypothetical protein